MKEEESIQQRNIYGNRDQNNRVLCGTETCPLVLNSQRKIGISSLTQGYFKGPKVPSAFWDQEEKKGSFFFKPPFQIDYHISQIRLPWQVGYGGLN